MFIRLPTPRPEIWPPIAIRDIIEVTRSRELELGFQVGVDYRRGTTTLRPLDGGEQERVIAAIYRSNAQASSLEWPRTEALLDRIAETYQRDAKLEDQRA